MARRTAPINMFPKDDSPLPPGVERADTGYSTGGKTGEGLSYDFLKEQGVGYDTGFPGYVELYLCSNLSKGTQWVVTTLPISGGNPPRTYGIGVDDGKVYTVGRGPHVKAVVQLWVRKGNWDRVKKYVELWKKGMADAGAIRDRISSRRSQGILRRSSNPLNTPWNM
jgi:hypothetical protein